MLHNASTSNFCSQGIGVAGDYRTQFHKKAEAIASAMADGGYRFGMLHVKAVDDTGHDRQVVLKVQFSACHLLPTGGT